MCQGVILGMVSATNMSVHIMVVVFFRKVTRTDARGPYKDFELLVGCVGICWKCFGSNPIARIADSSA